MTNLLDHLRRTGSGRNATRVRPNDIFVFDGGLNLVDPPVMMKPGQLLGVKNYEPGVRGGYTRVEGYERFDGQASPTRANYWVVEISGVTGNFVVGQQLAQYANGAPPVTMLGGGTIAYARSHQGGKWVVGVVQDATSPFNGFIPAGDVYAGPAGSLALMGTSTYAFRNGASDDVENADIIAAKTEFLRSRIQAVGAGMCSGPVRGVAILRGTVVAWRDSLDGTRGLMFRSTDNHTQGWVQVDLGSTVGFTGGASEFKPGDQLVGATSSVTVTVGQVSLDTGAWTGTAVGEFSVAGGTALQPGENLERLGASGVVVGVVATVTANTLPPGGKYRTRVRNFYGYGDRECLYAVNGVGRAFEWDGTHFTYILTGMTSFPTHLFVINDHLGLCYPAGSIQNSGFQRPLSWDPILGADERNVGGEIQEVSEETTSSVFIGTRQQTYVFSGQIMENFRLDLFSPETGMLPDTAGRLGQTIYLDDRGFTTLRQTQAFGNFATNSISDKILPLVQTQLAGAAIANAIVSRRKNLYRCVFKDGVSLVISSRPGNRLSGWTVVSFPVRPHCLVSGEVQGPVGFIPDQTPGLGPLFPERVFMGCDNGFVYECDIGNSFDGEPIEAFARFTYHNTRSPDVVKHYRKAVIDVDVMGLTTLFATVDFNYGNRSGQAGEQVEFLGGGGLWDVANWDQFKWSGQAFDQVVLKIEGDGYNIGLFFYSKSDQEASHTLYNVTYHYSMRRLNRGSQGG